MRCRGTGAVLVVGGILAGAAYSSAATVNLAVAAPATGDSAESEALALFATAIELRPYGREVDSVLHTMIESQVASCMSDAGFEYVPVPFVPGPEIADAARADLPPLPTDEAVELYGFDALRFLSEAFADPQDVPAAQAATAAQEANWQAALADAEWSAAWQGEEESSDNRVGGCVGAAYDAVESRAPLDARAQYSAMSVDLLDATDKGRIIGTNGSREPLASALSGWRECMDGYGYSYATPNDAMAAFIVPDPETGDVVVGPESVATDEEIAAALADLDCRVASGFREALRTQMVENLQAWFADNDGAVAELRETTEHEAEEIVELAAEIGIDG